MFFLILLCLDTVSMQAAARVRNCYNTAFKSTWANPDLSASHHRLHDNPVPQRDSLHASLLLLIEIETEIPPT